MPYGEDVVASVKKEMLIETVAGAENKAGLGTNVFDRKKLVTLRTAWDWPCRSSPTRKTWRRRHSRAVT